MGERVVGIPVAFPPEVSEDSWLRRPEYADDPEVQAFLRGLSYARTQTHFIASAATLTAEQCYWVWALIQMGATK